MNHKSSTPLHMKQLDPVEQYNKYTIKIVYNDGLNNTDSNQSIMC